MFRVLFLVVICFLVVSTTFPSTITHLLFIGNSISKHPPAPGIGWFGNWGMASSREDADYVHRTIQMVDSAQGGSATFNIEGMSDFERSFHRMNIGQRLSFISQLDTPDVIVIQIGDNVNSDTATIFGFGNYYREMLQTLRHMVPSARIVCISKFWADPVIDTMIFNSAVGPRTYLVDIHLLIQDTTNCAYSERVFINREVGSHPGDRGMDRIARALYLSALTAAPDAEQLEGFIVHDAYPNPFNPEVTVRLVLQQRSQVLMKIYDIVGREIITLIDDRLAAGTHTRSFAVYNCSGVYILRSSIGGVTKTLKLIKLK